MTKPLSAEDARELGWSDPSLSLIDDSLKAIASGEHVVVQRVTEAEARRDYERSPYFGHGAASVWIACAKHYGMLKEGE